LSVASVLPGRAVRATRRVLTWIGMGESVSAALALGGPRRSRPEDAKAMMRLLASMSIMAFFGGVLTSAAVVAGGIVMDRMAGQFSLSDPGWAVVRLMIKFLGMLPMAMGVVLTFLASAMVRAGSGRDIYASIFRQWLWAMAGGSAVFAACCWAGMNVVALSSVSGLSVLAGAALTFQRQGFTVRPGAARKPVETPGGSKRLSVAFGYVAISSAGACQVRILTDIAGVGTVGLLLWVSITVALLGWFLRRVDRKSRPPGRGQMIGAVIGTVSGLLLQMSMVVCMSGRGVFETVCWALAGMAQVPLAALVAVIVSRQRRLFAYAGGRARGYLAATTGGAAAGIAGVLALAWLSVWTPASAGPAVVLVVIALGICAGGIIRGVVRTDQSREQLRWTCTGAVLMLALAAAMLPEMRSHNWGKGVLQLGVWLTRVASVHSHGGGVTVMPAQPVLTSSEIDQLAVRAMLTRPGKWLAAVVSDDDVPMRLPTNLSLTVLLADFSAAPAGECKSGDGARQWQRLQVEQLRLREFDGIYFHSLPSWHVDAWRHYSRKSMMAVLGASKPDAPAMLRLQACDRSMPLALAAVRAFEQIVGPCRVYVKLLPNAADLLAITEVPGLPPQVSQSGVSSVQSRRLWYEWPDIKPLELLSMTCRQSNRPSIAEFASRLAPPVGSTPVGGS